MNEKIDRNSFLRVTEILKPFTGIEFVDEAFLRPAALRGSFVHECIENRIAGFENEIADPTIQNYMKSFDIFWEDTKDIFAGSAIIQEERLYCDNWKISGKPDLVIAFPEHTYVIDWKTSAKTYKYWRLQAAAYRYLCEVNNYKNIDTVLFVRINKLGKRPILNKYETYYEDLETFHQCLELYNWFDMKNRRK